MSTLLQKILEEILAKTAVSDYNKLAQ